MDGASTGVYNFQLLFYLFCDPIQHNGDVSNEIVTYHCDSNFNNTSFALYSYKSQQNVPFLSRTQFA